MGVPSPRPDHDDPASDDGGPSKGGSGSRPVGVSVAAGLVLAGVVVTTFLLGPTAFFALMLVVVLIAQAELYAVLKASGYHPASLLGLISGGVLLVAAYARGPEALALTVVLPLPLLVLWGLTVPTAQVRSMIVSTYLGIIYGPFLIGFACLLLRGANGLVLTATIVGATAVHDSAGFLLGRKIGRHPMAPRTSPGKSWEGFAAGTVLVVGLSVAVLPLIHPYDVWLAFRFALVLSLVAPLGDLAESLLKRDLGVKDMGSLMPGHGGLFDRIDALLFNAPVAYVVMRVLGWSPG